MTVSIAAVPGFELHKVDGNPAWTAKVFGEQLYGYILDVPGKGFVASLTSDPVAMAQGFAAIALLPDEVHQTAAAALPDLIGLNARYAAVALHPAAA